MEDLPIAAGLQILNCDSYSKGQHRTYRNTTTPFDSRALIDNAFAKLL
jgi:hypothetical protein